MPDAKNTENAHCASLHRPTPAIRRGLVVVGLACYPYSLGLRRFSFDSSARRVGAERDDPYIVGRAGADGAVSEAGYVPSFRFVSGVDFLGALVGAERCPC